MDKIIIKKHDPFRILITETLPYEIPLIHSNTGFYHYLKNNISSSHKFIKDLLIDNRNPLTPYNYSITKNEKSLRVISIPHPSAQYEMGKLIHENAELVTYLCSKSNFSIRRPTSVASYFYESTPFSTSQPSDLNDNDVAQLDDITESNYEDKFSSSYFSYDGFTLLYKFFNSLKFQSIEKKYSYFLRFDIAKCFSSIYTHSISWAIKGRLYSKDNISSNSFDGKLDTIIRRMNDNETNGIIVGPEFSRIFAEIILQSVDISVEKRLVLKGYKHKVDYTVQRYVDDYFVFTNNEATANDIYSIFIDELSKIKLYINESKEQRDRRPFITKLTIAKTQVIDEINLFFKSIRRDKSHLERKNQQSIPSLIYIYKPYTRSNSLITKIKGIIKKNDTNYDAFSGLVLSVFRSRLQKINQEISHIKDINSYSSTYRNFIVFCIDFLVFLFSMNIKSRTSHLMSQIVVIIGEITNRLLNQDKNEIIKKLKDETSILIDLAIHNYKPRVEFINYIISLKSIFKNNVVNDDAIIKFYGLDAMTKSEIHLDYFEITTALYLLCQDNKNTVIKEILYELALEKVNTNKTPRNSSEIAHLILDLGTFPYVSIDKYKEIIKLYHFKTYGTIPTTDEINNIFKKIKKNKNFFIDWNESINIKKLLQKKEMQRGYDS